MATRNPELEREKPEPKPFEQLAPDALIEAAERATSRLAEIVKENPVASVAIGFAAGVLLGRIFSRRD